MWNVLKSERLTGKFHMSFGTLNEYIHKFNSKMSRTKKNTLKNMKQENNHKSQSVSTCLTLMQVTFFEV